MNVFDRGIMENLELIQEICEAALLLAPDYSEKSVFEAFSKKQAEKTN